MQLNGSDSKLQSEINITPLVDVVLVLLIIFMVVVPLLLKGYDADMPRLSAEAVPPVQTPELQVVLSIVPTACRILDQPAGDGLPTDCRVTLNEQEIPATDLPARVAQILGGRPADRRGVFLAPGRPLEYQGGLRIRQLSKARARPFPIEILTNPLGAWFV